MNPEKALEIYLTYMMEGCSKTRYDIIHDVFKKMTKEAVINEEQWIARDIQGVINKLRSKLG